MTWKKLWIKALSLQSKGGLLAYDRAKVMIELVKNAEYLADCKARKVNAEDDLNRLTDGLNLSFLELREMLKHYPKQEQWASGQLRTMYDRMVREIRKTTPVKAHVRGPKPAPIQKLEAKLAEKSGEVERLKAENANLKKENTRLKRALAIIGASDQMAGV